jgi:mannose-6-phosphate isomerase-like protein (cupin superfamily)
MILTDRPFETSRLAERPVVIAPDGSEVRPLLEFEAGGMAHFSLAPGKVSKAVVHKTVEEIWYIISGRGEMWRSNAESESVTPLEAGTSITIPLGTRFQFRSFGPDPLQVVAVTMPRWPGEHEATVVTGKWPAEL